MRFRPSQSSRSDEPRCARPCRFEFEVFVQVSRRKVRKVEGLFGQAKAKKRRRKKKTHLDDPEPVRSQLQDLQLLKFLQPLDLRDLVRGHIQLLQGYPGARIRSLPGERGQRPDLVVRQLQAAQGRERREVRDRRQLVVVEDELLDLRGRGQPRDSGGVGEEVLAEGELAEVWFSFSFFFSSLRKKEGEGRDEREVRRGGEFFGSTRSEAKQKRKPTHWGAPGACRRAP